MNCTHCGAALSPGDRFCPACGAELADPGAHRAPAPSTCPRCGAEAPAGAQYCPSCGARLEVAPSPGRGPAPAPSPAPGAVQAPPLRTGSPARRLSPPPPQESKKEGKGCCIAIAVPVGLLALLLACGGVMLMAPPGTLRSLLGIPESITVNLSDTPTARATSSSDGLSAEQQQLVDRLSYPDTFALVIGADEAARSTRLELWNYHVLGTCFTFEDGAFRGVDEAMEIWEPLDYPALRPDQFRPGMDVEDVNDIVGDIPYVGAEVVPEIAAGTDIYLYNQGLVVAFADGDLVYASTEWALPTDLP